MRMHHEADHRDANAIFPAPWMVRGESWTTLAWVTSHTAWLDAPARMDHPACSEDWTFMA